MSKVWFRKTRIGTFSIMENGDRFHLIFNESENLGSYAHPQQASDDLALGAIPSIVLPNGKIILDTSNLGIPGDLRQWEFFEQQD